MWELSSELIILDQSQGFEHKRLAVDLFFRPKEFVFPIARSNKSACNGRKAFQWTSTNDPTKTAVYSQRPGSF
jgi:hypothetical protein